MRQLHTLANILSDAKITEQDLHMLYIDFCSAFNTIDHDELLQTIAMYDLGFPALTDAINVAADLYTNATTRIKNCRWDTPTSLRYSEGQCKGTLSHLSSSSYS